MALRLHTCSYFAFRGSCETVAVPGLDPLDGKYRDLVLNCGISISRGLHITSKDFSKT